MKKIVLALFTMLFLGASVFAQSDLQVLAVVKYNKSESITVKQLKKRVGTLEKQIGKGLTVEEKKQVLNTLIEEKLIAQAAQKEGLSVTDSMVEQQYVAQLGAITGFPVTEADFENLVKQQFGVKSLDEFFQQSLGMTKAEYKEQIKNTLIRQQYVIYKNQAELQSVAPTDEQIRMFYEANKANFIWNDMAKLLIVAVPNGNDPKAAKIKATELRNKYADKKLTAEQLKVQSKAKDAGFIAGDQILAKSQLSAQILGMTMENLLYLFNQKVGFVSDVIESETGYTFISIVKKYDAKMLGISDIMQPETTVTVYDYIRAGLTQQLQGQFLQEKLEELAKSLNTTANVEMKKTGAALDKLLNWGD